MFDGFRLFPDCGTMFLFRLCYFKPPCRRQSAELLLEFYSLGCACLDLTSRMREAKGRRDYRMFEMGTQTGNPL
jgi:hypothetical protein